MGINKNTYSSPAMNVRSNGERFVAMQNAPNDRPHPIQRRLQGAGCMTHVHVNRPSSTRFVARVRPPGWRKYIVLGKPTKSKRAAILRMARRFAMGSYKRGDVLVIADYYDPVIIAELVKR